MEGFVAARTLTEAFKRVTGPLNAEMLIGALESIRELNLGGFFVDFAPAKHAGSKFVDLTILTADGKVRR
jgi:branched-chain amino acid transport system substrate-binding protein